MKKTTLALALVIAVTQSHRSFAAEPRFEKVSEHCYYLETGGGGANVAAVATKEGILIIDPPSQADTAAAVVESLKNVTSEKVRWVVFTNPVYPVTSGARYFAGRGAVFLASSRLHKLSMSLGGVNAGEPAAPRAAAKNGAPGSLQGLAWFIFDGQMRLFPADVEIRLFALERGARTGGDVIAFMPAEKVLLVGRLYEPGCYPDIDAARGGNAAGWIEGLRQVVDFVPVLKAAIPQAKPAPKTEPEKTLEEGITVITAFGKASNLQNMKDMLQACRGLQNDISRAVRAGRSCNTFLASPGASQYRNYRNLDAFACGLFDDFLHK
jgi:hypothetical protein